MLFKSLIKKSNGITLYPQEDIEHQPVLSELAAIDFSMPYFIPSDNVRNPNFNPGYEIPILVSSTNDVD